MKKTFIVSHYNNFQFLDLMDKLKNEFNFFIYNKSNELLKNVSINRIEIKCDNVGREGYTYINHIINNYDNLNDINVFVQDDVYNHLFNIEYFIENFEKNKDKEFYQFPCTVRSADSSFIYKRTVVNGVVNFGFGDSDGIFQLSKYLSIPLPESYETDVCENFFVSRDRLHRYSKEKYIEILNWVEKDPVNEWLLEHSWKMLFM